MIAVILQAIVVIQAGLVGANVPYAIEGRTGNIVAAVGAALVLAWALCAVREERTL